MSEIITYTRDQLEDKLTKKERIFCHEYIVDWNKSRAARAAGYSEDSAANIGWENVRKPHITQYIDFIKLDLEKESGITKLRNLQELSKIAYSNIANLHDSWITLSEFNKLTKDERAAIESIDTKTIEINGDEINKEIEYVKIKLYPKITAIQEINKMMGYNAPERKDISINSEQPLFDDDDDDNLDD